MRSLLAILLSVYPLICAGQEAESLHIQPGDVLRISVRGEPDISCSVSVRANGFITMPLVNEIKVAGLTVQQVQTLVVERLQHFVANPEVTVSIEGKVHTHPNFPNRRVHCIQRLAATVLPPILSARFNRLVVQEAGPD